MSSASLRRSITSSDPRSPLQLSSLVTSFPQHQIITSFQTFQVSPMRYSPRRVNHSPIYAQPPRSQFHNLTTRPSSTAETMPRSQSQIASSASSSASPSSSTSPRPLKTRSRSSSLAKLLAPKIPAESVPGMCPCGQSGRSVKHMVRDCPDLEAQRQRLLLAGASGARHSFAPTSTVEISAQPLPQGGAPKLVQIVRKRTRTLLGKVVDAPKERDADGLLTAVI